MFEQTIAQLKGMGLLNDGYTVIVCTDQPSMTGAVLFGAIGAAVAAANAEAHILAANQNEIRVFDIDKKSGVYLDNFGALPRETILKVTAGGLGAKRIIIKTNDGNIFKFQAAGKFRSFKQKEALAAMMTLLKTQYPNK